MPLFNTLSVPDRRQILFHILDFFRLEYAIYSENYLTEERIRQNRKEIEEKLIQPWKFEDSDKVDPFYLRYDTLAPRTKIFTKSLASRVHLASSFGSVPERSIHILR